MNNIELTIEAAQSYARNDVEKGLDCDSSRYGAMPISVWDVYYTREYNAQSND